jgi:hypothetical protein
VRETPQGIVQRLTQARKAGNDLIRAPEATAADQGRGGERDSAVDEIEGADGEINDEEAEMGEGARDDMPQGGGEDQEEDADPSGWIPGIGIPNPLTGETEEWVDSSRLGTTKFVVGQLVATRALSALPAFKFVAGSTRDRFGITCEKVAPYLRKCLDMYERDGNEAAILLFFKCYMSLPEELVKISRLRTRPKTYMIEPKGGIPIMVEQEADEDQMEEMPETIPYNIEPSEAQQRRRPLKAR